MKAEINYDEVYEKWNELPDCGIRLPGESMWGKVLPDGNYGINNVPLSPFFRLHDIVLTKNISDEDADKLIVHRRWNGMFWYNYIVPEGLTKDEASEVRKKIYDELKPLGQPGFMWVGLGYLMCETDFPNDEIYPKILECLSKAGIEGRPYEDTYDDDDDDD